MKKIQKQYKKIFLVILFICFSTLSFSQIQADMMKYWYYRERLKYFVVSGDKQGESQIICVRNKINAENDPGNNSLWKNADYGQHGKHTGFYLGVLATEYYLLNKNGQYSDAAKTYNELYLALNAIKVYWDEQAEPFWGEDASFNGFFIRGNVPCDFFYVSI